MDKVVTMDRQQRLFYKLVGRDYQSVLARGKYKKIYIPDTVVETDPNTLGCMLFETYDMAKSFYSDIKTFIKELIPCKILVVNGIGPKIVPKLICCGTSAFCLSEFYDFCNDTFSKFPVKGTVCFRSVKVLYQMGPSLDLMSIKTRRY